MKTNEIVHSTYRPDIDGLRAIAVLSVVAFHYFPEVAKGGFVGVDVFFVISGFLISTIILENLYKDSFNFVWFYSRRIRRIFPSLTLVLLFSYLAGWFLLRPEEFGTLSKHILGGSTFSSNYILWKESGYFDASSNSKPLLHLWSLAIEEQFYLAWPIVLTLVWRIKPITSIAIVILIGLSFYYNLSNINVLPALSFYSPFARIWEIMLGAFAATIIRSRKIPASFQHLISTIGSGLLCYSIIVLNKESDFPGKAALWPTLGTMLLIVAGARAWPNRLLLSTHLLVSVGLLSFPFYLWHWPVLFFSRMAFFPYYTPPATIKFGLMLASLSLAWASYRLVERPIRFGMERNWIPIGLCVLLTGIGSTGYLTYAGGGATGRIPEELNQLLKTATFEIKDWRGGQCFIETTWEFPNPSACVDPGSKPLVFLWGDSQLAALYPGLTYLGKYLDIRLAQFTASQCQPSLDWNNHDRMSCDVINNSIFNQIASLKPDMLIISGLWSHPEYDLSKLPSTISALRKIGVKNVLVLGSAVGWLQSAPQVVFDRWKINRDQPIPVRFDQGLDPNTWKTDRELQKISAAAGVSYISLYDKLCDARGCQIMISSEDRRLLQYDGSHFTTHGAQYVGWLLAPEVASQLWKGSK